MNLRISQIPNDLHTGLNPTIALTPQQDPPTSQQIERGSRPLNKEQKLEVDAALIQQRKQLNAVIDDLSNHWDDPKVRERFMASFGKDNVDLNRQIILERSRQVLAISQSLNSRDNFRIATADSPQVDPSTLRGLFAQAYDKQNNNRIILLGPKFWETNSQTDTRPGTLTHEMSHYKSLSLSGLGSLATTDFADHDNRKETPQVRVNGRKAVADLFRDNPGQLIDHADAFQYYVEDRK
jgi:Lysine-specific metallo-endopeptidase